jgi:hypothetical protein
MNDNNENELELLYVPESELSIDELLDDVGGAVPPVSCAWSSCSHTDV